MHLRVCDMSEMQKLHSKSWMFFTILSYIISKKISVGGFVESQDFYPSSDPHIYKLSIHTVKSGPKQQNKPGCKEHT